ncbi:MEDS domain-containing protein [Geodermatophilus sp. SYSU D00758]
MHRHPGEFDRRRSAFLADGLREGLRVAWTGAGGVDAARAELAGLGDVDRLLVDGTVQLLPTAGVYGPGGVVEPERVLAGYAAATEAALADGFRGLRVGADVTDLARTPAQQDAFARYEFLVDGYMADHPFSAMCGYRTELGVHTVAAFAALHDEEPPAPGDPLAETSFRVFACPDGALGLAGEFDLATVPVLDRLLARLRPGAGTGALVVDMAGVAFHDHKLLVTLDAYARTADVALSLRSAPRLTGRLLALLPEACLRVTGSGVTA